MCRALSKRLLEGLTCWSSAISLRVREVPGSTPGQALLLLYSQELFRTRFAETFLGDTHFKDVRIVSAHHYYARNSHVMHGARALSSKVNNNRANGHCYNFAWI